MACIIFIEHSSQRPSESHQPAALLRDQRDSLTKQCFRKLLRPCRLNALLYLEYCKSSRAF